MNYYYYYSYELHMSQVTQSVIDSHKFVLSNVKFIITRILQFAIVGFSSFSLLFLSQPSASFGLSALCATISSLKLAIVSQMKRFLRLSIRVH